MNQQKLMKLNQLINQSYECFSFSEFLKLAILKLHELVMYDSGMFFCGISKDCSFFKPYLGGNVEEYYQKQKFKGIEEYLSSREECTAGREAFVYRALDYTSGIIRVNQEPRRDFLMTQDNFHILCLQIVHKGRFLGEIYLHRSKERPDFDEEDLFVLQLLQPHISTVFSIIHTVTAIHYIETDKNQLDKKGMCILDGELGLIGGNVTGLEMLKYSTGFGSSILYHIKELCEDMLSHSSPGVTLTFKTVTLTTQGEELQIDIYFRDGKRSKKNTQFVIVMELVNAEHKIADYKFKFTKRESDIIDGIIQGKNNSQLAENFNLSENTIKTHIKSIYHKVGANNRTELAYILMLNKS